jgi:hypothetical protein
LARLSFAYLFFGEAKKSKARGRRKPSSKQKSRLQAKHTRLLARLFFGYFLLAKQKKVTRPSRPKPVLKKQPFFCSPFLWRSKEK